VKSTNGNSSRSVLRLTNCMTMNGATKMALIKREAPKDREVRGAA
jgi:hypothetical protein